jgi:Flp pilus assembly pilin Flp
MGIQEVERMKKSRKNGQTMVEYIIIVAIIAVAALAIFGVFSDRIRALLGGATEELGGDSAAVKAATTDKSSQDFVKSLKPGN